MVGEDKGKSAGANVAPGLLAENGQTVKKLKGHLVEDKDGDMNLDGSSDVVCRTYKRRKRTKVVEDGFVMGHSAGQSTNKSMNGPLDTALNKSSCTQASVAHMEPHGLLNDSSDLLVRNWKGAALKQMLQSLESDGGLKGCIQEALTSHSEASCAVEAKESGKCCEDGNRGSLPSQSMSHGIQNGTKAVPNGSVDEPKSRTVTEFCQHMFLDIVKSEKFAQLCHVLFENFEGMKADKFFDISRIHSRMKDGSYEGSSLLFHSDIQQLITIKEASEVAGNAACYNKKHPEWGLQKLFLLWYCLPCAVDEWGVTDGLKITQLSDIQVLFRFANEKQAVETFHRGKRWFGGNFLKLDIWKKQDGCVDTHLTGDTVIVNLVGLLFTSGMLTFSKRVRKGWRVSVSVKVDVGESSYRTWMCIVFQPEFFTAEMEENMNLSSRRGGKGGFFTRWVGEKFLRFGEFLGVPFVGIEARVLELLRDIEHETIEESREVRERSLGKENGGGKIVVYKRRNKEVRGEIEGRKGVKGERKKLCIDGLRNLSWNVRGMNDPNKGTIIKAGFRDWGADVI
ncbi:hypothetical protein MTR67_019871 [Solanum verrucosum]|uniref:DUF4283 domain-containing protein n=1 Tax=Solanum verrucosum TaxID=315347 RepID=A0AAF0QTQ3_SOLVR|nr:hypothetical protein MTR67_019871 [Solanum verrucosum]